MEYKTIIFDLDGTAIPNKPKGQPSKRLIKIINKNQNKLNFCAATGRPISNTRYILKSLKLVKPCIVSAGTKIINPITEEILWEKVIKIKDVQKILKICLPYPYEILFKEELFGTGKPAVQRKANEDMNVIYIMQVKKVDSTQILKKLKLINNITASEVPSWASNKVDIHITNKQATKEQAIKKLLSIIKSSKNETIGVGDGNNDIHLFRSVGLRVAMGNATDYIKNNADIITKSVEKDGLALIIENYSKL